MKDIFDTCLTVKPEIVNGEQEAEEYKNSMNKKLREIKAPYLLERYGFQLHPVLVVYDVHLRGAWVP